MVCSFFLPAAPVITDFTQSWSSVSHRCACSHIQVASPCKVTADLPPQVEPLRCEVNLDDLLELYRQEAEKARVEPLPEENNISVFLPSHPSPDRGKWDPGIGSSWAAVPRGGGEGGVRVGAPRGGEGGGDHGYLQVTDRESTCGDPDKGDATVKTRGKRRKRPRGLESKLSRKRGGKDLKSAGSNSAARKLRLTEKWTGEGSSYQTTNYSLLHDGSHSSTGLQGLAPPIWKRKEVLRAYRDGGITQALGGFFPVPYEW